MVFLTKNFTEIGRPLAPQIRIDLDLPDGTSYNKIADWGPEEYSASRDRCDVRIGDNSFSGDLHSYTITARIEDMAVDVTLTGEVPAWRPRTGHMYFGPQSEREFNWLPAVPQGKVDATYSVGGKAHTASGVGYHDHNWGNALSACEDLQEIIVPFRQLERERREPAAASDTGASSTDGGTGERFASYSSPVCVQGVLETMDRAPCAIRMPRILSRVASLASGRGTPRTK